MHRLKVHFRTPVFNSSYKDLQETIKYFSITLALPLPKRAREGIRMNIQMEA